MQLNLLSITPLKYTPHFLKVFFFTYSCLIEYTTGGVSLKGSGDIHHVVEEHFLNLVSSSQFKNKKSSLLKATFLPASLLFFFSPSNF